MTAPRRLQIIVFILGLISASTDARAQRILTPEGLGPVRIGMTVSQAEEALRIKLKPFDPTYGDSRESCWQTYRLGETDPGVVYMVWYGRIVRIAVDGDDKTMIATDKGIRIGDSDARVKEVYGPSLKVEVDPQANTEEEGSDLTAFTKNKRRGITYETFDRKVVNFRAGLPKATLLSEGCS